MLWTINNHCNEHDTHVYSYIMNIEPNFKKDVSHRRGLAKRNYNFNKY